MRNVGLLQGRTALRLATVLIAMMLTATASAAEFGEVQPAPRQADQQSPAGKQTRSGLTAREAYEKWNNESARRPIVLDVRTPEEFLFVGHPDMAWNVPVAAQSYVWDSATRQFPMKVLPDFVDRVGQIAKPDDTLLVMCRSGSRSAMAVELLTQAGYRNVYNITDGMEGDAVADPNSVFHGQRLVNGWKNSGLPWTYDVDPSRMVLPPHH